MQIRWKCAHFLAFSGKCAHFMQIRWKCAHFLAFSRKCTHFMQIRWKCMHFLAFSWKCAHFMQIRWKCAHFMQIRWKCAHFHWKCAHFQQNQDLNNLRFRWLTNIGLSYIYERPIMYDNGRLLGLSKKYPYLKQALSQKTWFCTFSRKCTHFQLISIKCAHFH